jgi:hypothetical protein
MAFSHNHAPSTRLTPPKGCDSKGLASHSLNRLKNKHPDFTFPVVLRLKVLRHWAISIRNPAGSAILFDTTPFRDNNRAYALPDATNEGKLRCHLALNRSYSL